MHLVFCAELDGLTTSLQSKMSQSTLSPWHINTYYQLTKYKLSGKSSHTNLHECCWLLKTCGKYNQFLFMFERNCAYATAGTLFSIVTQKICIVYKFTRLRNIKTNFAFNLIKIWYNYTCYISMAYAYKNNSCFCGCQFVNKAIRGKLKVERWG